MHARHRLNAILYEVNGELLRVPEGDLPPLSSNSRLDGRGAVSHMCPIPSLRVGAQRAVKWVEVALMYDTAWNCPRLEVVRLKKCRTPQLHRS